MISIKQSLLGLVYLAALIAVAPLISFLPPWVLLALGCGFILGLFTEHSGRQLLNDRAATLLSIGFFALFLTQVSLANLATPLISFLCLLLAVRLAGSKSGRHILQIFTLSAMILASSSLLTLNMGYVVYLVILTLIATSGLVLLSFYETAPNFRLRRSDWSVLLKILGLLPLGSLCLMLLLFVILPRTQTPLWNFLNPQIGARTGLSDKVSPGTISELAASDEIAFRAEMDALPALELYWRGIVFDQFNGRNWTRSQHRGEESLVRDPASVVNISIFAEPKSDPYLVTLDRTLDISGIRHQQASDGVVTIRPQQQKKTAYRLRAHYGARSRQESPVGPYLKVPEELPQRLVDLGETISTGENFAASLEMLDRFFMAQELEYAATGLQQSTTPIDHFLFNSKRGYCEYFASSYALILRLAGVPTRLVGGYLGGEFNRFGGYYLVKEEAAHVWVEVLDDEGIWQSIDPSRLAVNAAEELDRPQQTLNLQAFQDLLEHHWSRMVLNYDLRQQFSLLRNMIGKMKDLKELDIRAGQAPLSILAFIAIAIVIWMWRGRRPLPERLLHRYRNQIAKKSGHKSLPGSLGLFDLARLSGHPLCGEFAAIYGAALYREKSLTREEIARLQEIIKEIKHQQTPLQLSLSAHDEHQRQDQSAS